LGNSVYDSTTASPLAGRFSKGHSNEEIDRTPHYWVGFIPCQLRNPGTGSIHTHASAGHHSSGRALAGLDQPGVGGRGSQCDHRIRGVEVEHFTRDLVLRVAQRHRLELPAGCGWHSRPLDVESGERQRPALAVDKNTGYLWLVWNKNASGDIYYSTYNGTAWTYLQKVTGAQTSIYGIPSVGGGNGITVVWTATDAYYSNWNDPGWSTPQTVGGSGWTAQPGWTLSLTNALPGAGLYWSVAGADVTAQVYGAAYLAVGWVGPVEIGEGCGWTATEPSFLNTPAAADFDNGENSALFWVGTNGLVNYTYETFEGCEYADPANVSGTGLLNGSPTVAIGPTLSILAWTQYRASHSTTSTVWYMNPLTLPGLD
jgi:hypothetical protein